MLHGLNKSYMSCMTRFISVEQEIEMLMKAKDNLETQLGNFNRRLEKLSA
jgi:hypothetical protein